MWGYLDGGSPNPAVINVSGLPASLAANYAVIVYIAGDSPEARTGDYTIGGTTILATQGSYALPFKLASNGVEGNYIEFSGLGGLSFSLSADLPGIGNYRSPVDAIQIIQVPLLTWTGLQSNQWTTNVIASPKNWQDNLGNPADYLEGALGSTVTFDDSAKGATIVDISMANVTPGNNVMFNNSKLNYTLQSNEGYGIAGTIGLNKSGSGTLSITNQNLFMGPVTFGGGTIAVPSVAVGGQPSLFGPVPA